MRMKRLVMHLLTVFLCFVFINYEYCENKIGLIIGDSDKNLKSDYKSLCAKFIERNWAIQEITQNEVIPQDINLLLIIGNNDLHIGDAKVINDYIGNGGRAIFAVKSINIKTENGLEAEKLENNPILYELSAWGIIIKTALVFEDYCLKVPYKVNSEIKYIRYCPWIMINTKSQYSGNALTDSNEIDLYWASPIDVNNINNIKSEIILSTTSDAWLQTNKYYIKPDEVQLYESEKNNTKGRYVIGVCLQGKFLNAFTDNSVLENKIEIQNTIESKIVVISCSDFLSDIMSITNSEYNASFIIDLCNGLIN